MNRALTPRQAQCLHIIEESIRERGISPSIREIRSALGVASTSGVAEHLRALQKKGYLRRHDLVARGLMLLNPDETGGQSQTSHIASVVAQATRAVANEEQAIAPQPRVRSFDDDTVSLMLDELHEARTALAETQQELEDARATIARKERRISRLETLLSETRQTLRDAASHLPMPGIVQKNAG